MSAFEPLSDEFLVLRMSKHWKNYIAPTFSGILCLALLFLRIQFFEITLIDVLEREVHVPYEVAMCLSWFEFGILNLGLVLVVTRFLDVAYTRYYVTNKRIICCKGWLSVGFSDMLLDKCEYVGLSQTVWERMFGSGDIICVSPGARIYLDDVYHARKFRQTVMELLSQRELLDAAATSSPLLPSEQLNSNFLLK